MPVVTAKQIRAARALLDWSQEDLAIKSRLSPSTIYNLETGLISRASTSKEICETIEKAGIEFLDGEGIRRRLDDIKIYRDKGSCDRFFDDVIQTITAKGGDIIGFSRSQEMVFQSFGILHHNDLNKLERLNQMTTLKCVLYEPASSQLASPLFQFRLATARFISPSYFYVYGNKYAVVLNDENEEFQFVVFTMMSQAQAFQRYFYTLWNQGAAISAA